MFISIVTLGKNKNIATDLDRDFIYCYCFIYISKTKAFNPTRCKSVENQSDLTFNPSQSEDGMIWIASFGLTRIENFVRLHSD